MNESHPIPNGIWSPRSNQAATDAPRAFIRWPKMSKGSFTESVVEDAALAWLESLDCAAKHGPENAPGELLAEETDHGQIRLRDAPPFKLSSGGPWVLNAVRTWGTNA